GGEALFHADMTVGEAVEIDRRAVEVLSAFHIGGCSSCAVSPEDTLRYAAEGNGQDVQRLLDVLNKLVSYEGDSVVEMLGRQPNVQISL
ncbi:MAG: hypothetical protein M3220_09940, partial [Chloroflexota bacterium]|nr:hypothetical protein [Chloroflexota bacterium]